MTRTFQNRGEKTSRPFCQAAGCFELADFYIVLKETEMVDYSEASKEGDYEKVEKSFEKEIQFDGFKMIIYFCERHDDEFKYLIRGSEFWIAKRCNLHAPEIQQG